MLGFLFSMESLALSLGCDRTQLELAVAQSHPEDPAKTRCCGRPGTSSASLSRAELRARCDELLGNPLVVPAYPRYLSGFVHALEPVPGPDGLRRGGGVQRVRAAARPGAAALAADPDHAPCASGGADLAPLLIREAGRIFPGRLAALDAWVPPWRAQPEPEAVAAAPGQPDWGIALLAAYPATCDALEVLLLASTPAALQPRE